MHACLLTFKFRAVGQHACNASITTVPAVRKTRARSAAQLSRNEVFFISQEFLSLRWLRGESTHSEAERGPDGLVLAN